ncbi:MAG: alpha/beta fold hydrolase [Actinomycetota bacterium]
MRAPIGEHELEYETFGDADRPTYVLVNGLGSQLLSFPADLCSSLAAEGFRVVRFDNRGVGLSTPFPPPLPSIGRVRAALRDGEPPEVRDSLSDMAADVVGLLDHLGVDRAHVAGVSMGGMIVQHLAIEHPGRLLSATSIMSTTGDPSVGRPSPEAWEALLSLPPTERAAHVEHAVETRRVYSGELFDADDVRQLVGASFDRSFRPEAATHQMAAVMASGDRTERLRSVDVPFLVLHGREDTLIDLDGGEATALAVPGARLVVLASMGHDLPRQLWPRIVDALSHHAEAAAIRARA